MDILWKRYVFCNHIFQCLTAWQLSRIALERSAEAQADYALRVGQYAPDQLVFVDESAVDRRTTYRGRAWAIRGRRATRKAFFCCGRWYVVFTTTPRGGWIADVFTRFSVLPALSLTEGILHCDIIEGAFDADTFYTFIDPLLDRMQPYPAPNSVVIMDNCRIHKSQTILDLIESRWVSNLYVRLFKLMIYYRGMRYEFLPPYSPDFNPIELVFSAMKYHLRRNGEYIRLAMTHLTTNEIYCTLLEALFQISLADVFGWFRYCGYVWNLVCTFPSV